MYLIDVSRSVLIYKQDLDAFTGFCKIWSPSQTKLVLFHPRTLMSRTRTLFSSGLFTGCVGVLPSVSVW